MGFTETALRLNATERSGSISICINLTTNYYNINPLTTDPSEVSTNATGCFTISFTVNGTTCDVDDNMVFKVNAVWQSEENLDYDIKFVNKTVGIHVLKCMRCLLLGIDSTSIRILYFLFAAPYCVNMAVNVHTAVFVVVSLITFTSIICFSNVSYCFGSPHACATDKNQVGLHYTCIIISHMQVFVLCLIKSRHNKAVK